MIIIGVIIAAIIALAIVLNVKKTAEAKRDAEVAQLDAVSAQLDAVSAQAKLAERDQRPRPAGFDPGARPGTVAA